MFLPGRETATGQKDHSGWKMVPMQCAVASKKLRLFIWRSSPRQTKNPSSSLWPLCLCGEIDPFGLRLHLCDLRDSAVNLKPRARNRSCTPSQLFYNVNREGGLPITIKTIFSVPLLRS